MKLEELGKPEEMEKPEEMGMPEEMAKLEELGKLAKESAYKVAKLDGNEKNQALLDVAEALERNASSLAKANAVDMKNAKDSGMSSALLDRLLLDEKRICAMAEGVRGVAKLPDPIGEVLGMQKTPGGLLIGRKRVPMGVIGIIYEARPNVTSDAFSLCFKAGSASILRCGKDAINSAIETVRIIKTALKPYDLADSVQLIEDTSHEVASKFMRMNEYLDVLIPRGGHNLISSVVKNATVPVIETGTGNCHVYVDESADFDMALSIIENAKTQRIGVCNAIESLVIHSRVLDDFMPRLINVLGMHNVEIRCDERSLAAVKSLQGNAANESGARVIPATEEDFGTEYLDYIISVKTVDSIDEAISHINHYNTGHSEAIITRDYENAQRFLDEVDASAVYVNASTRFTDGGEFGFGAEIGISTQKLHARGPMGLKELTTYKYIIYGNGQIRK